MCEKSLKWPQKVQGPWLTNYKNLTRRMTKIDVSITADHFFLSDRWMFTIISQGVFVDIPVLLIGTFLNMHIFAKGHLTLYGVIAILFLIPTSLFVFGILWQWIFVIDLNFCSLVWVILHVVRKFLVRKFLWIWFQSRRMYNTKRYQSYFGCCCCCRSIAGNRFNTSKWKLTSRKG